MEIRPGFQAIFLLAVNDIYYFELVFRCNEWRAWVIAWDVGIIQKP